MDKNRTKRSTRKFLIKLVSIVLMVTLLLDLTAAYIGADSYYTVRVNYLYADGTHAHDPYIATFPAGQPVNVTVTNPNVSGYDPMMLNEGETDPGALPDNGTLATTTSINIDTLDHNVTYTVYYLAGLSHYRARFYLQNIYDDLYTTDQTLNAQYQDLLGVTGSFPDHLENVEVEGFTSLFHEPDAIAADGSTVFRLYYDRNYYTVGFDLGEGGYGVEPIYAKYQTSYHINEPKQMGYSFMGWLRTDKDSKEFEYAYTDYAIEHQLSEDETWTFIDENGDPLVDGNGDPLFDEHGEPIDPDLDVSQYYLNFTDGTIPAHDTHYKAMWDSGTTSYSVVYWIQNPTGRNLTTTELNAAGSVDQARAMIAENYTVVAAKDVTGVRSGEKINLDTVIKNAAGQDTKIKCLFPDPSENSAGFDLSPQAVDEVDGQIIPRTDSQGRPLSKDNKVIDFPAISEATSSELVGKEKYYYFEEDEDEQHNVHNISSLQFSGAFEEDQSKQYIEVQGDGTTRINVYYNRKEYTLKFFYARQNYENGQLTNTYSLTNSTKDFSKKDYGSNQNYMEAVAAGSWQSGIAGSLPYVKDEYLKENGGNLEAKYIDYTDNSKKKYRYYYYEVKAKYNEP